MKALGIDITAVHYALLKPRYPGREETHVKVMETDTREYAGRQNRGRLLGRFFSKLIFGGSKLGGQRESVKQALYPLS